MVLTQFINNEQVLFDMQHFVDISIPITDTNPVNAFHLPPATFEPFKMGTFVGSVEQGGPVRCEILTIAPHGNGTHTECIGHILGRGYSVLNCMSDILCLAQLVTVPLQDEGDCYACVTAQALNLAWKEKTTDALIIRTLPNAKSKRTRNWSGDTPPFITPEAMQLIVERGVKHLVVDFPSVDPEEDAGALTAHKIFWGIPDNPRENATITELVYIPDEVPDEFYAIAFNVGGIHADAVPSRPVLFIPMYSR